MFFSERSDQFRRDFLYNIYKGFVLYSDWAYPHASLARAVFLVEGLFVSSQYFKPYFPHMPHSSLNPNYDSPLFDRLGRDYTGHLQS